MAHFNPVKIEACLKGISFPADKQTILETARNNNADQEELDALNMLPEQEYTSPTDITKALSESEAKEDE